MAIRVLPLLLVGFASCGSGDKSDRSDADGRDSTSSGTQLYAGDRILVDSVRVDFLGDGMPALVIATRGRSDSTTPADRFDRVDIFSMNSYRRPVFTDVLEYGSKFQTRDVTGDGLPEFVVEVDAGGNAPITSLGLHVYGRTAKGKITLLFFSGTGAPVLQDLDDDGVQEILVSDQYWGLMPHSEAVGFTRQVYAFNGSSYIAANNRFRNWYDKQIGSLRKAFEAHKQKALRSEEGRTRLYTAAVELLLWTWARGGAVDVKRTWRMEQKDMRSLLAEEHYEDVLNFVNDVEAMGAQQQERLP